MANKTDYNKDVEIQKLQAERDKLCDEFQKRLFDNSIQIYKRKLEIDNAEIEKLKGK